MKIESFLLCYNEKDIMPFVVKHYQKFCDRITIYDNHSTDGSAELARSLGCEVIPFGTKFFDDAENMNVKNNCWKGSDADFVVVADFDEVLWQQFDRQERSKVDFSLTDFRTLLEIEHKENGTTIFQTDGWQIMSDYMPMHDILAIRNGFSFDNYSKCIIFNPHAFTEINYGPGAHTCDPVGNIVWSDDYLFVLHYKHIGGVDRTIRRYRQYQKRMSKNNRKNGWGIHYNQTPAQLRKEWDERMLKSKPLL